MATYQLIATATGTGSSGVLTFSTIPSTYTDLVLKYSLRSDTGGNTEMTIKLNSTVITQRNLLGNGSTASSTTNAYTVVNATGSTASTYTSGEIYIPNYLSTVAKSLSSDAVEENNGTTARAQLTAGLASTVTSAVTTINLTDLYGNWTTASTAYLYGVKSS
jgi:hypothetical protein